MNPIICSWCRGHKIKLISKISGDILWIGDCPHPIGERSPFLPKTIFDHLCSDLAMKDYRGNTLWDFSPSLYIAECEEIK